MDDDGRFPTGRTSTRQASFQLEVAALTMHINKGVDGGIKLWPDVEAATRQIVGRLVVHLFSSQIKRTYMYLHYQDEVPNFDRTVEISWSKQVP